MPVLVDCFRVSMCKILNKTDTFLLNYSNLFRDHFLSGYSQWLHKFQTETEDYPKKWSDFLLRTQSLAKS